MKNQSKLQREKEEKLTNGDWKSKIIRELKLQTYCKLLNYDRFLLVAEIVALHNNIMKLVYKLTNSIPFIYEILWQGIRKGT